MTDIPAFNYERFLEITRAIPVYNKNLIREGITKKIRGEIVKRDSHKCQLCGLESRYGNPEWGIVGDLHIHHIIPNGPSTEDNLITLCKFCHNAVHMVLYRDGKSLKPSNVRLT